MHKRMRQLMTFGDLSNIVDNIGTDSMHVARICNPLRLSRVLLERNTDVNLLHGKGFSSETTDSLLRVKFPGKT
jgi:hypothetical protein